MNSFSPLFCGQIRFPGTFTQRTPGRLTFDQARVLVESANTQYYRHTPDKATLSASLNGAESDSITVDYGNNHEAAGYFVKMLTIFGVKKFEGLE